VRDSAVATARFARVVLPHLDAAYNFARWLTRNGTMRRTSCRKPAAGCDHGWIPCDNARRVVPDRGPARLLRLAYSAIVPAEIVAGDEGAIEAYADRRPVRRSGAHRSAARKPRRWRGDRGRCPRFSAGADPRDWRSFPTGKSARVTDTPIRRRDVAARAGAGMLQRSPLLHAIRDSAAGGGDELPRAAMRVPAYCDATGRAGERGRSIAPVACPACAEQRAAMLDLRSRVRSAAPRYPAPASLGSGSPTRQRILGRAGPADRCVARDRRGRRLAPLGARLVRRRAIAAEDRTLTRMSRLVVASHSARDAVGTICSPSCPPTQHT